MERGSDEETPPSSSASPSSSAPPAPSPASSWSTHVFGNYDWAFLCMPRSPFHGVSKRPPFYSKNEKIPLFLSLVMGLQHALAMVGGIITAPVIISGSANFANPKTKAYLVAAAFIVSSVASFIQVYQIRIPFTKYVIGSGLLSVMGISFAYIPVAQHVLVSLQACSCNGAPCQVNESCEQCTQPLDGQCRTGEEAYGAILGTVLVVCWFQTALSFLSPRTIRRVFPPVVTGTCLILVGVSLVGIGFELWGGGQYCASQASYLDWVLPPVQWICFSLMMWYHILFTPGFRDAFVLFISNGFSVGGFTAFALNLILPFEEADNAGSHSNDDKGSSEMQGLKAND